VVERAKHVLALALVLGVAACPPAPKKPKGGTSVTVDGDPPDFPVGFDPGQPLPDPAAPDPAMFGLKYLERVSPSLEGPWRAFLEDCRLRLPPDDPLNSPTLEARFELVVSNDGQLLDVTKLASSGNDDFDGVAEEIANDSGPFGEPPVELMSDDDLLRMTWLFARDRRQVGVASAQLRRVEWSLDQAVPRFVEAGNLAEAARRIARGVADARSPSEQTQLTALTARVLVAVLRTGMASSDPAVQRIAVDAVATAGAVEALAPAIRELRSIADGAVEIAMRGAAISALAALGDRDAAPLLQGILEKDQGGNPDLSGEAARALVVLGQSEVVAKLLTSWLTSGHRAEIGGALQTLARAPVKGMSAGIAKHVTAKDVGVRVAACAALGPAAGARDDGGVAWKALRKGLDDREASVRAACARGAAVAAGLGAVSRASYYRAVELFKDKDERVRAGAVLAATRLEPGKVDGELSAFAKEKSAPVLAALAEGLAAQPAGAPHKKLVSLAGSTDTLVRAAAVRALASRKDAESRKLAASLIVDPEPEVRLAALVAIDDAAALDALATDADPALAAIAQTRRLLALGRWATLPEVLAAVADGAAEATRVRLAAAWLRAK